MTNQRAAIDGLSETFNVFTDQAFQPAFARLVCAELEKVQSPTVLDIGCGRGIGRDPAPLREIRQRCGSLWGVEPDESIEADPSLFDHMRTGLMEDADLPKQHFDLAFACFVVEHVQRPAAFLRAVSAILKPGATFIAITPNAKALFGRTSAIMHRLKLDEPLLRAVKGKRASESYHYPLAMKMNHPMTLHRLAAETGFEPPTFAFFQFDGTQRYFPRPLRPLYHLLIAKRRFMRNPLALDTMVFRMARVR